MTGCCCHLKDREIGADEGREIRIIDELIERARRRNSVLHVSTYPYQSQGNAYGLLVRILDALKSSKLSPVTL